VKQPYNRHYRPPIPTLTVRLYSPVRDTFSTPIEAIVDTGSDAYLIPLGRLLELGAEETAPGWLITVTGERKPVSLFFIDVYVGESALAGIRVIADPDTNEVIIGRDVLNKLPLFLDGPESTLIIPDAKALNRLRHD